jgi:DNA polymerase-1
MDILREQWTKEQKTLSTKMRGVTANPEFNPGSPEQVIRAFELMGVPDVDLEEPKAASGKSANKNKLNDIVEQGKAPQAGFASDVMVYRNRKKMIGTYLDTCRDDLDTDGRVRYSWMIAGTVTGRLSCQFFHQISKIDEAKVCYGPGGDYVPFTQRLKDKKVVMRDMFMAPEGYKYVYGDFSQVELRIVALVSNDKEMLLILADPNGDLHTATAFEFLCAQWPGMKESDVSKTNRAEVGKRVNFGMIYGSEGYSLVKTGKWIDWNGVEHNFTWNMLDVGMASWKKRFVGVGEFIDNTPDLVRSFGGVATNVFGRERHFGPLLNLANDFERGRAEREAINYYIQSVATSITNRTIIAVEAMLKTHNVGKDIVCLVNTVHDSVAYEVRDSHVEWFTEALALIAGRPIPQLNNATFKMDVGTGANWTDAEMAA